MKKLQILLVFLFLFIACNSTKPSSYKVDYSAEHTPSFDFGIQDEEALTLCKNGWFIINELNDSFYINQIIKNKTNDEVNYFYKQKVETAFDFLQNSNSIEENYYAYFGIGELYSILIKNTKTTNYIENQQIQQELSRIAAINYFKAYLLNSNQNTYIKLTDSLSHSIFSKEIDDIFETLIKLPQTNSEPYTDLHYKKGLYYKNNALVIEAYNEFCLAQKENHNTKLLPNIISEKEKIQNDYQRQNIEYLKELILKNKFTKEELNEYYNYKQQLSYRVFMDPNNYLNYSSIGSGKFLIIPNDKFQIIDVTLENNKFNYLITRRDVSGMNYYSLVSDYQLNHHYRGIISDELLIIYLGTATYQQNFDFYKCHSFYVLPHNHPQVIRFKENIQLIDNIKNCDIDYLFAHMSTQDLQLLIDSHIILPFFPQLYKYINSYELINNKTIKVINSLLNSPVLLSPEDYEWLCCAFTKYDELNYLLEDNIEKCNNKAKCITPYLLMNNTKNRRTVLNHVENVSKENKNLLYFLGTYTITDEKLIKELLLKGLDLSAGTLIEREFSVNSLEFRLQKLCNC